LLLFRVFTGTRARVRATTGGTERLVEQILKYPEMSGKIWRTARSQRADRRDLQWRFKILRSLSLSLSTVKEYPLRRWEIDRDREGSFIRAFADTRVLRGRGMYISGGETCSEAKGKSEVTFAPCGQLPRYRRLISVSRSRDIWR